MSSGVLLQLAAYGKQNINLTGNPEISLFKTVYKRHTLFSMNDIEHTFTGDVTLGQSQKVIINKVGDLLSDMYLNLRVQITEEDGLEYSFINNLGHNIIEYVDLHIGQTRVDRQYGEWLEIYRELATKNTDKTYYHLIDAPYHLQHYVTGTSNGNNHTFDLLIPLQFWFCKYSNVPLPLLALQYEEVHLIVKFRNAKDLVNRSYLHTSSVSTTLIPSLVSSSCNLITNQIWLGNEERQYYVHNELTYLIEQVQYNRDNNILKTGLETVNTYKLVFNHPIKAIFWTITQDRHTNLDDTPGSFATHHQSTDSNAITVQLIDRLWDFMITSQNASDALAVNVRHFIKINSSGVFTLINKATGALVHTFGTTLDINKEVLEGVTIEHELPTINRGLTHVEICADGSTPIHELTRENFYISELKRKENLLINSLFNHLDEEYDLYTITPIHLSNNASNVATNLKKNINHNFNIYSLHPKTDTNPTKSAKLTFNGVNRTSDFSGKYYNYLQPLKCGCNSPHTGINMYSFALKPFDYQPTGNCNFSKLDNVNLEITQNKSLTNGKVNIYALNHNILKIKKGVAGLAYSS